MISARKALEISTAQKTYPNDITELSSLIEVCSSRGEREVLISNHGLSSFVFGVIETYHYNIEHKEDGSVLISW